MRLSIFRHATVWAAMALLASPAIAQPEADLTDTAAAQSGSKTSNVTTPVKKTSETNRSEAQSRATQSSSKQPSQTTTKATKTASADRGTGSANAVTVAAVATDNKPAPTPALRASVSETPKVEKASAQARRQKSSTSLVAVIDLSSQRMTVRENGRHLHSFTISSGRAGYHTPRGSFRPKWLSRMHYSRKYNNSPMPYSVFFNGGIATHGTNALGRLGRPASHGCIRLRKGHARRFFNLVRKHGKARTRIIVRGSTPATRRAPAVASRNVNRRRIARRRLNQRREARRSRSRRTRGYYGNYARGYAGRRTTRSRPRRRSAPSFRYRPIAGLIFPGD